MIYTIILVAAVSIWATATMGEAWWIILSGEPESD